MPSRIQFIPVQRARTILSRRQAPPTVLPCLNPRCRNECAWTVSDGRPALFCSTACRVAWGRDRQRLLRDLEVLERACEDPNARQSDLKTLQSRAAHVRWVLERYRAGSDSISPRPRPTAGRAASGGRNA